MPTSYTETYFPILLQVLLAMAIAGGMLVTSAILGHRARNKIKDTPYESGMTPIGTTRERFSVKFYLVAMIFILFDIETVFLYPWAVSYGRLGLFALVEMGVFLVLLAIGLVYAWGKGVLRWV